MSSDDDRTISMFTGAISSSVGPSFRLESNSEGIGDGSSARTNNTEGDNDTRSGNDDHDDDDDDAEEEGSAQNKKKYNRHTPQQIRELENLFRESPHPDEKKRTELSRRLNLDSRQVKFWFQNRRTQLKAQIERHENSILREENDRLKAENITVREAFRNPVCPTCSSPVIVPDIDPAGEEQRHLQIENARLKDELYRVHAIAEKFLGRQFPGLSAAPTFEQSVGVPDFVPIPIMGGNGSTIEVPMFLNLASMAMEELMRMATAKLPLWVAGLEVGKEMLNYSEYTRVFHRCVDPKPPEFVSEATRETGMVIMNADTLIEHLMDGARWMEMFPSMVGQTTTHFASSGVNGTTNSALLLMHAELQVLSPLVPKREVNFLRYCRQHAEGAWAVVDMSVDGISEFPPPGGSNVVCRRLPSGCVVQAMANGFSKVTWVEHVEYSEAAVHQMYRPLLRSGLGLGAPRWLATLQRHFESLAFLTSPVVPNRDHGIISSSGRMNVVNLARSMADNFCAAVCASPASSWNKLNLVGGPWENIRVATRRSADSPGEPVGDVVSVVTSVWLPLSPRRVFDFLHDGQHRGYWDVLLNTGTMLEMAHIATGQDHGNAISILRHSGVVTVEQSNTLILQETCVDATGMRVVYAPVDFHAMHALMGGDSPDYLALPPSGFVVAPDKIDETGQRAGGSLLTVALQVLPSRLPADQRLIGGELLGMVHRLISSTLQKIRLALGLQN